MKAAIVGLILVMSVGPQAKPDFNGTWVLNPTKSAKAIRDGISAPRGEMTLKLTEKAVTVTEVYRRGTSQAEPTEHGRLTEETTVCAFGPSPAENDRPNMRPVLCSAKWDGDKLVTTSTPKPYPNIANTAADVPRVAIYSISGEELTAAITFPIANRTITATLGYDKAK